MQLKYTVLETLFTPNGDRYTKIILKSETEIWVQIYFVYTKTGIVSECELPHDHLHKSSVNNRLNIFGISCAIKRASKSILVGKP